MSYFFYYYLIARSLVTGSRLSLYFRKFILPIYRYLPFILKLVELFYRLVRYISFNSFSIRNIRFVLLILYNLINTFQLLLSLRVLIDYYIINYNETPKFIKVIYELTDPYFEFIHKTFPKNAMGSIVGFYVIYVLSFLIKKVYLITGKYDKSIGNIILTDTVLLLNAVSDEKIIFS